MKSREEIMEIQTTYLNAPDEARRIINQFVFKSIEIQDTEISNHELAELTDYVLDEELPKRIQAQAETFAGTQTTLDGTA